MASCLSLESAVLVGKHANLDHNFRDYILLSIEKAAVNLAIWAIHIVVILLEVIHI